MNSHMQPQSQTNRLYVQVCVFVSVYRAWGVERIEDSAYRAGKRGSLSSEANTVGPWALGPLPTIALQYQCSLNTSELWKEGHLLNTVEPLLSYHIIYWKVIHILYILIIISTNSISLFESSGLANSGY